MNTTSRSKKVLAPLAVLLAAGALAVGSGATFTSTTSNTISSVTAGTLTQTNSKDGGEVVTEALTNLKPGDVRTGSVTITNTGSLAADFTLTETASTNTFTGSNLTLEISQGGTEVWAGTFGALDAAAKIDLGTFAAGADKTYDFTIRLAESTPNGDQGKAASAAFKWDATQTN